MRIRPIAALAPLMLLTSCNLFDPLDAPSGDDQILSMARACFDDRDFECARKYYRQLAGTQYADAAISEEAFTYLDEQGASMGNFMISFVGGDGGKGVTKLANYMLAEGLGATADRRAAIYAAFRMSLTMTQGTELHGLTKFVTAAALFAQLLGEEATALGQTEVTQRTIAANPGACESAPSGTVCSVPAANPCSNAGGMPSGATPFDFENPAATTLTQTRDLKMIHEAISNIKEGLDLLGAGGAFGSVADFAAAFQVGNTDLPGGGAGECYRQEMLNQGIGSGDEEE